MNIAEYSIKNKVISWLFIIILAVGGLTSFLELGRLEDPVFTIKDAMIISTYPGATSKEVEEELTYPLEKEIRKKPEKVDYVVLGFDKTLTYKKLWDAHELILSGVNYVATHPDLVCPLKGDKTQPDTGAMIELLAASTGKRPLIIGKPSKLTVEFILKRFKLKKSEVAMVGDRLYTDMKMAYEAGITGILVLSGETKREDLKDLKDNEKYFNYVFEDVGEIINRL